MKEFDPKYHFSCQFTADLLAMNAADFIITSTYQEIAGRLAPSLSVFLGNLTITKSGNFPTSARQGLDNMKATQHLQCQGFTELFQVSMSLTQSSTLLLLGLNSLPISPSLRERNDSLNLVLLLRNYFTVKRKTMSTCKPKSLIFLV